jgi:hydrogenase-4 component F
VPFRGPTGGVGAAGALAGGPVSRAMLAILVLNAGLVVLLRLRGVVAATPGALAPGPLLMALGLASLLAAAWAGWRRGDAGHFLALAALAQSGVVAFAFGLGAPLAGLLLLTAQTLGLTAALHCLGQAARLKASTRFADLGGLLAQHRALGLTFVAALAGLAALPPFGPFAADFLLTGITLRRLPWLALPLGLGLTVVGVAVAGRLIGLACGPPTPDRGPQPGLAALVPAWLHLAALLALGLAAGPLGGWLAAAAGGTP